MVRPIRNKQIPNIQEAIKEAAWKQIAEEGAPALSLRAIARALQITAPAIYNYFPDRDALVTALIVDAFTSFGDWQLEARDSVSEEDHIHRMRRLALRIETGRTHSLSVTSSFSARPSQATEAQWKKYSHHQRAH